MKLKNEFKKIIILVAVITGIIFAIWTFLIPWYINKKIVELGSNKGIIITIKKMNISLQVIELYETKITSSYFKKQTVTLNRIDIILSGISIEKVVIVGGKISLRNNYENIKSEYKIWSTRFKHISKKHSKYKKTSLYLTHIRLSWYKPYGDNSEINVSEISFKNKKIRAKTIKANYKRNDIDMKNINISKNGTWFKITASSTLIKKTGVLKRIKVISSISNYRIFSSPLPVVLIVKNFELKTRKESIKAKNLEMDFRNFPHLYASSDYLEINGKIKFTKSGIDATIDGRSINGKLWFRSVETTYKALTDSIIKTGYTELDGSIIISNKKTDIDIKIRMKEAEIKVIIIITKKKVVISIVIPDSKCQDLITSIPKALLKTITPGTTLSGNFRMRLEIEFTLPSRRPTYARLKLNNGCIIKSLPVSISVSLLKKPFLRKALGYDKKERIIKTGPGTRQWVPLRLISKYAPLAFETMEDPGFMWHHGFEIAAISSSIEADIEEERFVRGASTITMQLAKNLWLNREKTISRKLQEAVLTTYLEQELSKKQILQLYVNVVEFGPGIYGIKAASLRYFNISPMQLTLSQSLLLASVLPRPDGVYFTKTGEVQKGRLSLIRKVMKIMLDTNKITKNEYSEGIKEIPMEGISETKSGINNIVKTTRNGLAPNTWSTN